MKRLSLKGCVFATVLTLLCSVSHVPFALAANSNIQTVDLEITVRVNQKGFLDHRGKLFTNKNQLNLPKNSTVRITFVFDENMTSLAYGDTHQVAITAKKAWTKESEKIWMFNQQANIVFQTGPEGNQYRAYCIIDCIGMEHLNNLVINVV